MTDMKRDPRATRAALNRDRRCQRCLCATDLAVHHIQTIFDGGSNDIENLIVLCGQCHREWHRYFDGNYKFDDFLSIPPIRVILGLMNDERADHLTLSDVHSLWLMNCLERAGAVSRDNGGLVIHSPS